jgi:long-chain-alcohol oxidase
MQLTSRQRRALGAIVDTFFPGENGIPSASELGAVDALAAAVGRNQREAERKQFGQLLSVWDSQLLTTLGGGGWERFSALPQEQRERVLLSWCDSRVPQRRAAFQALRKGALLFAYMLPRPDGSSNPIWDAIEYPGPRGRREDAPPKSLQPVPLSDDTDLDCDVVVVGSGAGGGTAAGVLASAGLDVVVLEAGDYFDDEDFTGSEYQALTQMYLSSPQASDDQSIILLAGACLGGGTVVNYTTSFRTREPVREEWARHGVAAFAGDEYTQSLDAVWDRLGVNSEHGGISPRDKVMEDGCRALGWHIDAMPRNVRGCDQGEECGYCGLGCRLGAKQSVVKTWLSDAAAEGARIVVRVRAERVVVQGGVARGVEARTLDGHRVTVRSRAVVVACGALHTPALLRRSGLQNEWIGRNLLLHPATVVWGVFDEEVRPWTGTMQSRYSAEHRDMTDGYGVLYETAAAHPHLAIPFTPWRGAREHRELMESLSHTTPVGVLLRDRDGGQVKVGRDGEPVVKWRLSEFDREHVRKGIDGAAQILETAGARRIYSSHSKYVGYRPDGRGRRAQFLADCDRAGYGTGQVTFGSFHIMGTARMGGTAAWSACDPAGQTWDVRDLVVCDASCFPTASGTNPMISIEAIAHMNARALAARLA